MRSKSKNCDSTSKEPQVLYTFTGYHPNVPEKEFSSFMVSCELGQEPDTRTIECMQEATVSYLSETTRNYLDRTQVVIDDTA